MLVQKSFKTVFLFFFLLHALLFSSCSKKDDFQAFKGTVVNATGQNVPDARVQIFNTPEDWLTGHNVVASFRTDASGYFESSAIYEAGEYYIFIEKYDTSNWEIRKVEQGLYPKISIPEDINKTHIIDYNNMSNMAGTSWLLTNIHKEYTKPGATAKEWQSIWTGVNNCVRDNELFFNKDLTLRVYEGNTVCKNKQKNIIASFVPPIIIDPNGCSNLPYTAQGVKEFSYSDWPEMEAKNAKMYISCNSSVGQVYILYTGNDDLQVLEVYSRR